MSTYLTKYAKKNKLKVVDATDVFVVEVSKRDISTATQANSKDCALSRACRHRAGVKKAYFFRTAAYLEYDDKLVRYALPPSVQKEIVSFDRAKIMGAGHYQLTPPAKTAKLGAINKRAKKRPGRHQPGNTNIKRKIVHRAKMVRTLQEPT